jgi:hypothetical protein
MQDVIAWLRQILQLANHRWDCLRGRHEWIKVDRYIGHDVGMNRDRCKHCQAIDEWLG